jgi:hypothetical protein
MQTTRFATLLVVSISVLCISCGQSAPPAAQVRDPIARLNAASEALRAEEPTLADLSTSARIQTEHIRLQVFRETLPKGLSAKGLSIFCYPDRGADSIEFGSDFEPNDADQARLKKLREYADIFAAECKQPNSEISRAIAEQADNDEWVQKLRHQQDLVDKLQRERDEAQAAIK